MLFCAYVSILTTASAFASEKNEKSDSEKMHAPAHSDHLIDGTRSTATTSRMQHPKREFLKGLSIILESSKTHGIRQGITMNTLSNGRRVPVYFERPATPGKATPLTLTDLSLSTVAFVSKEIAAQLETEDENHAATVAEMPAQTASNNNEGKRHHKLGQTRLSNGNMASTYLQRPATPDSESSLNANLFPIRFPIQTEAPIGYFSCECNCTDNKPHKHLLEKVPDFGDMTFPLATKPPKGYRSGICKHANDRQHFFQITKPTAIAAQSTAAQPLGSTASLDAAPISCKESNENQQK